MQSNDEDNIIKVLNVIIEGMRTPPMPDDRIIDTWEEKQIAKWDEFFKEGKNEE